MTVGVGVVARKQRWKHCPRFPALEIPATRLSWATSGSFRPRLGLAILSVVVSCCVFALSYHYLVVVSEEEEAEKVALVQEIGFDLLPDQSRRTFDLPLPDPEINERGGSSLVRASLRSSFKMDADKIANPEAVEAVAKAGAIFGGKLYGSLTKSSGEAANMILSPYSVKAVLAMVLAGARGDTADQIRSGLALPADKEDLVLAGLAEMTRALTPKKPQGGGGDDYTLSAASRLFVQSGFRLEDRFVAVNKDVFLSEPEQVDFAEAAQEALAVVNGWAEDRTMGKIKDLLSPDAVNSQTRLILANAVYFKGTWKTKFNADKTEKSDFHVLKTKTVKADMMKTMGDFRLDESTLAGARAIELPYRGDRLSMVVVLPDEVDGLRQVEEAMMAKADFGFDFQKPRGQVPLGLPKFRVETSHDLNEALQDLGMTDMFSDKADFSGINEQSGKRLSVSSVVQKAFIEVNEEGSEAAAATGAVMMLRAMPPAPTRPFVCDRPFVFYIKDKLTGVVLFSGRILDPTAS